MADHGVYEGSVDGFVDVDSLDAEADLAGVEEGEGCDLFLSITGRPLEKPARVIVLVEPLSRY